MSLVYTPFKNDLGKATYNLQEAGIDARIILVMTNTTADTEQDSKFVGDFVTLDECNGANYVRKALANQAMNEDDPNNRGEFDADDFTWTALGVGTRQNQGMVLYSHVGADGVNPNIAFIDSGGFPFDGNGGNVTVTWNVEGILQIT